MESNTPKMSNESGSTEPVGARGRESGGAQRVRQDESSQGNKLPSRAPVSFGGRVCLGFGEFEGKCPNDPGDWPNPYWCERCDKLRIEHLNGRFVEISELFEPRVDA